MSNKYPNFLFKYKDLNNQKIEENKDKKEEFDKINEVKTKIILSEFIIPTIIEPQTEKFLYVDYLPKIINKDIINKLPK